MDEKIMIKGAYGTVYEDVEVINGVVKNDFTGEEYEVEAKSLIKTEIISGDIPEVGDLFMTSSGEFEVDALRGCYVSCPHDYYESVVIGRFVEFEGDNYIPEKSTNGGGYLHKWYEIIDIKSINYVE